MQFCEDKQTGRDRLNSLLKCSILRNLMFLIDRISHYYMYLENRRQVFLRQCTWMSRIFIWLESSSTLNFISERDPDEIVQTHMLS